MASLAAAKYFFFCSATLIVTLTFELTSGLDTQAFQPGIVYLEDNWRRLVVYEGEEDDCHQVGKRKNVREFLKRRKFLSKSYDSFNTSAIHVLDSGAMDKLAEQCDANFAQSVISDDGEDGGAASNEVDDLFFVDPSPVRSSIDRADPALFPMAPR